jgi:hypothetical protein
MTDMTRPGPPWNRPHGFLSDDERKHLETKVRTCTICGLELLKDDDRAPGIRAHLDCMLGLERYADR